MIVGLFLPLAALAQLPEGQPITLGEIEAIIAYVARFLVVVSVMIAFITIIVSGVVFMTAGESKRIDSAKAIFKYGIIGTFIVLGVGVIMNTIAALITREFFCRIGIFGICIY